MSDKQKLLIVTNLYPLPWQPNRATFNYQQFEALKKHFEIAILVPVAWPEYLKNKSSIDHSNKHIRYVPYFYIPKLGRRLNGLFMYQSIKQTEMDWIDKFNPDMVLGSWIYPEGKAVQLLAEDLGVDYFIKVHGSDVNAHIDNPVRRKLIKNVAQNATGVISVSNALLNTMHHRDIKIPHTKVVYNGVNQALFRPSDNFVPYKDRTNLLYLGNLKKSKGVMELLTSFHMISKTYPELTLTYAGSGEMLGQLQEFVTEVGIDDKVTFLGSVEHSELPSLMQAAKFVCLPSYAEGVPNVLLESMCVGTPVVSTNVGGVPEVVRDGVSGVLCQPRSSGAFYGALCLALNKTWEVEKVRNSTAHLCWNKNSDELADFILERLDGNFDLDLIAS